jgi:hypothetical protein
MYFITLGIVLLTVLTVVAISKPISIAPADPSHAIGYRASVTAVIGIRG